MKINKILITNKTMFRLFRQNRKEYDSAMYVFLSGSISHFIGRRNNISSLDGTILNRNFEFQIVRKH